MAQDYKPYGHHFYDTKERTAIDAQAKKLITLFNLQNEPVISLKEGICNKLTSKGESKETVDVTRLILDVIGQCQKYTEKYLLDTIYGALRSTYDFPHDKESKKMVPKLIERIIDNGNFSDSLNEAKTELESLKPAKNMSPKTDVALVRPENVENKSVASPSPAILQTDILVEPKDSSPRDRLSETKSEAERSSNEDALLNELKNVLLKKSKDVESPKILQAGALVKLEVPTSEILPTRDKSKSVDLSSSLIPEKTNTNGIATVAKGIQPQIDYFEKLAKGSSTPEPKIPRRNTI